MARRQRLRKQRGRHFGRKPLPSAVTLAWVRYFAGRTLQLAGMLLVTAAAALFFGADAERRMLAATGAGALVFVLGWWMARKRPPAAR